MWLIRAFRVAWKLLIFEHPSYIEFSTEFDKTAIMWCLYASPNKTCQVFIQKLFHINNILQNTHAPILPKIYRVDTGSSIMNRCNKGITYWHITQLHVFIGQGQMCILTDYPKYMYATMQRSSRTQNLFILNNIVSEQWDLEKSLSSLIRRAIQLPSSAKFFYFCC